MKNVIIYERNSNVLGQICQTFKSLNSYTKVFSCESKEIFLQNMASVDVDLFVIGISQDHLEENVGLCLAKLIRNSGRFTATPIVFVSGQKDLELYCYRTFHCYDYYCLPLDSKRFFLEMQKILLDELFFLRYGKLRFRHNRNLYSIPASHVVYAEIVARTLKIHTTGNCIEVPYFSIGDFLRQTSYGAIIQCHRSFVVNLNYVAEVNVRNRKIILIENRGDLDMGDAYRDDVMKALWLAP